MKLIINADDFGITEGATRAIVACHQAGTLTSTTLMANMAATEFAAARAVENPELGVGLHFNITLGQPLSPTSEVPSLVDEQGNFFLRRDYEKRVILRKVKAADVQCELERQFACLEALGVNPTHIDSHQHAHVFPWVFDVVAAFAEQKRVAVRLPWVWRDGRVPGARMMRKLRAGMLQRMVRRNARRWAGLVPVNKSFCSFFDLPVEVEALKVEHVKDLLAHCSDEPVEWMVHPAEIDEELKALTRITDMSEREYALLMDPAMDALLNQLQAERVHFGNAFA